MVVLRTCQQVCIGRHLYACDASDFQTNLGLSPSLSCMMAWILAPRSERLSRTTNPPSVGMRELRELSPALWSLMRHNFVDPFFGTVNTGCVTMPGRSLAPKGGEYRSSTISVLR